MDFRFFHEIFTFYVVLIVLALNLITIGNIWLSSRLNFTRVNWFYSTIKDFLPIWAVRSSWHANIVVLISSNPVLFPLEMPIPVARNEFATLTTNSGSLSGPI